MTKDYQLFDRNSCRLLPGLAALILGSLLVTASAAPISYHATVLPPVEPADPSGGNQISDGMSLSNVGLVVGRFGSSGAGYLWLDGAGSRSLSELFPWDYTVATEVNSHFMAGFFAADGEAIRPFVYSFDGGTTVLPKLTKDPHLGAGASAVSRNGIVVGWSLLKMENSESDEIKHATIWRDGVATDMGTLGGPLSVGGGVNSSGTAVGYSNEREGGVVHAFRWSKERGMESLPQWDDRAASFAQAINEAGWIAGSVQRNAWEGPLVAGALWSPTGELTVLPYYFSASGPVIIHYAEATALNRRGQAVGVEIDMAASEFRPIFWENGLAYNLSTMVSDLPPSYRLSKAVDINDRGQILVDAFDTLTTRFCSVLLTPEPLSPADAPAATESTAID